MAQYRINDDEKEELQLNLIRSHCTGSGNLLPLRFCHKKYLLSRLNTLVLDIVAFTIQSLNF